MDSGRASEHRAASAVRLFDGRVILNPSETQRRIPEALHPEGLQCARSIQPGIGVMKQWAWILAVSGFNLTSSRANADLGITYHRPKAALLHSAQASGTRPVRKTGCLSEGYALGMGAVRPVAATQRDQSQSVRRELLRGRRRNAPCNMFARYMLSGILEVRPFGRGPLRRFMLLGSSCVSCLARTFLRRFTLVSRCDWY